MIRLSTYTLITLTGLSLLAGSGLSASPLWPLKGDIDLSSGFGDYRPDRFHAGLDLRTGGVIGKPVHAPVDGHISRIKMSYEGYGKGLYLTGSDGSLYVFGHLSKFAEPYQSSVQARQYNERRYYVDIAYPADSFPVKAGTLIAYSGQTGVGAPHLHFERRTPENKPVNPLSHGFELSDKVPPVIQRVGIQITDERSLFDDGTRKQFVDAILEKKGRYQLAEVPYLNVSFGLLVDCFDQSRPDGMRQAVHRLKLFLDDRLIYQSVHDTIDYDTWYSAGLEYDYVEAATNDRWVRRLYHKPGNLYAGSHSFDSGGGGIGRDSTLAYGTHRIRIEAADASGNISKLDFPFHWGPPGFLILHDSVQDPQYDIRRHYFTLTETARKMGIDSIVVQLNRGKLWGRTPSAEVTRIDSVRFMVTAHGKNAGAAVLRLLLGFRDGGVTDDVVFSGIRGYGKQPRPDKITPVAGEDGLYVYVEIESALGAYGRVELFHQGKLLGRELLGRFLNTHQYVYFVPPRPEYAVVDEIGISQNQDTTVGLIRRPGLHLACVGFDDHESAGIDSLLVLTTGKADHFEPRFIDMSRRTTLKQLGVRAMSTPFRISPLAFPTRRDMTLSLRVTTVNEYRPSSGLCWLDTAANRWHWLGGWQENGTVSGPTRGGGYFIAALDAEPPVISKQSIGDQQTLRETLPTISFTLTDNLSGFADDRNIEILLDKEWLIPELDMETGLCQTKPKAPLAPGRHHLAITATDKAGNKAEKFISFKVSPMAKPPSGTR